MMWYMILSLSCVTFFNRYLFLEPKTGIHLPNIVVRMLKYAAPCLMVSICLPLVFFEHAEFRGVGQNTYLFGAIFTVFITLITRKLLLSILMSMLFFYGLNAQLGF